MAVTTSSRLGLTLWGQGSDPFTRQQLLHDHQQLDSLAAIDMQVATVNDLPPAGVRGRYAMALDTNVLYRDTGSAWVQIGTSQAAIDASIQAATATVAHDTATDADALTGKSALHYLTATSGNTNLPSGIGSLVVVEVKRLAASAVVQICYSLLAPRLRWHRYWDGTTWSAWKKIGVSDLAAPTQSLDMATYNITGLADPVNAQDAATRAYVLSEVAKVAGWSARVPLTLDASYARNSAHASAMALGYQTAENEKLVRVNGTIVNLAATGLDMNLATSLPASIKPQCSDLNAAVKTSGQGLPGTTYLPGQMLLYSSGADLLPVTPAGSSSESISLLVRTDGWLRLLSETNTFTNQHTYYVDVTYRLP